MNNGIRRIWGLWWDSRQDIYRIGKEVYVGKLTGYEVWFGEKGCYEDSKRTRDQFVMRWLIAEIRREDTHFKEIKENYYRNVIITCGCCTYKFTYRVVFRRNFELIKLTNWRYVWLNIFVRICTVKNFNLNVFHYSLYEEDLMLDRKSFKSSTDCCNEVNKRIFLNARMTTCKYHFRANVI